jgi:flagellar hook-associated protein 3 FlgL
VNSIQTPNGQSIQLNVPGDQIFTGGGVNNVFAALNNLVADFANGTGSASGVADLQALNSALNYVSQQRVVIDNSLSRLGSSSDSANSEKTELTAAQTNLMQADVASIATHLTLAETQQTALESVIAQLGSSSQSLFSKL